MRPLTLLVALAVAATPAAAQEWSATAAYLALSTRRAAAFESAVGTARATMNGIELSAQRGRLGISARGSIARFLSDSAATAAGEVSYGDIRVRYGPDVLAVDLGWGRRGLSGSLGRRDWSLWRIGATSRVPIGGSGLEAGVALGWYPSVSGTGDFRSGSGADAETRVSYQFIRVPAYAAIGYRMQRFTSRASNDDRPEELSSLFVALGVRIGPGTFRRGPRDEDGDGVLDLNDGCPRTPVGVGVDASGCRLDTDRDGVFDESDACAATPFGARVDPLGCRLDEDGDGVFDGADACPGTPSGARVGASGCRVDADGDDVFDEDDACPNTPAGTPVDRRGCRLDSDGDNVFDGVDACPNTPRGTEVDASGCPILFEDDATSLVLEGVTFELGSADLTANATTILDLVAEALIGNPEVEVRVAGHTDSSGSRALNITLSQERAESVLRYLAGRGVAESRMEALGFGPDQPIADNATPEGRQTNRRVELERVD